MLEGGHRVHCFLRWPQSAIKHGRDINDLTVVQDIAPTLLELCAIHPANRYPMDGASWGGLLRGEPWPEANRQMTIQYQFKSSGGPWECAVVPSGKWRLLKGKKDLELYNVANDPSQIHSVAGGNPELLKSLTAYYDQWHQKAYAEYQKPRYIHLGNSQAPEVILYSNDWQGDYCDSGDGLWMGKAQGAWDIEVETAGDYRVELSRWPFESGKALAEGGRNGRMDGPGALPIAKVQLMIADFNQTLDTRPADKSATFALKLKPGKTRLTANLLDQQGEIICGAMYVKVTGLK